MKLLVFITFATCCCNSCIVPVPHRRVHASGLQGQVLDEQTKLPVVGAKIAATPNDASRVITDVEGNYEIKPTYGWHGAYLFGPISYSMFPHFDMPYLTSPSWIYANGYVDKKIDKEGVIFLKPTH